ncbi:MAG: iron ABC transporter permease [Desulfovibrio sp.]|jgi:iron complex transport system permease protein|nr:iron ABC transporter permease [Desulfovibrio sp.]
MDDGASHTSRNPRGIAAAIRRAGPCPALLLLLVCWIVSLPLACLFGPVPLHWEQVLQGILGRLGLAPCPEQLLTVVGDIRLARVVLAALIGGALAVAGVALQGVLHNPLADPFTLGVSAGAACGASLAIALGGAAGAALGISSHAALISMAALAGALLALFGALLLGGGGLERVVLAGIAVSAFLGSIVALVKALHEDSVTSIVFWILGSFQGRGWDSLPVLLATLLPGMAVVALLWRGLDALSLGEEAASHVGLAVGRTRLLLLAGAGCMTAGCVAVAGIVGFVGLVAPHALRQTLGPAHGPLIAGAFLGGGLLLVWADVLARTLPGSGQELPVGVVTALLGAPVFALMVRARHA